MIYILILEQKRNRLCQFETRSVIPTHPNHHGDEIGYGFSSMKRIRVIFYFFWGGGGEHELFPYRCEAVLTAKPPLVSFSTKVQSWLLFVLTNPFSFFVSFLWSFVYVSHWFVSFVLSRSMKKKEVKRLFWIPGLLQVSKELEINETIKLQP